MAEEDINIGGESKGAIRAIDEVIAAIQEVADETDALLKVTAKMGTGNSKTYKQLTANLTQVNKLGIKITKTYTISQAAQLKAAKQLAAGQLDVGKLLKDNEKGLTRSAAALTDRNAAAEKAAQASKASTAQATTGEKQLQAEVAESLRLLENKIKLQTTVNPRGFTDNSKVLDPAALKTGSIGELKVFSKAQSDLSGLISTIKVGTPDLRKMFGEALRGDVVNYDANLNKVRDSIFKLVDAHRQLGTVAGKEAKKAKATLTAEAAARQETARLGEVVGLSTGFLKPRSKTRGGTTSGRGAPKATTGEEIGLSNARDELTKLTTAIKVQGPKLSEIFRDAASGAVKDYGTELNKVRNQVFKVIDAHEKLGDSAVAENERAAKSAEKLRKKEKKLEDQRLKAADKAKVSLEDLKRRAIASNAIQKIQSPRTTNQRGSTGGSSKQDTVTGTFGERLKVSESFDSLRELSERVKVTGAEIERIFKDVANGSVVDYGVELNRVRKAIIKIADAQADVGKFLRDDIKKTEAADKKAEEAKRKQGEKTAKAEKKASKARRKRFDKVVDKELKRAAKLKAAQDDLSRQRGAEFAITNTSRQRSGALPRGSQSEQLGLSAATDNLKKLAKTVKATGAEIDNIFDKVAKGSIQDYGVELNRIRNQIVKVIKAEQSFGNQAQQAHLKAQQAANRNTQAVTLSASATSVLVKTVKQLAKTAFVSLFIGSLFRLQQAFEDALLGAAELSIKIAEIETIQGKATFSTAEWAEELRVLSDSFGLSVLDQAEGAYQTLSTQIAKGEDSVKFLTTANKLAAAGVTDVASAVKVTATLLNAYGLTASQAGDVSGKLFKTVELGVVRISELAEGLGRVSVPAAKLGISISELFASLAQTTRQGVKTSEAFTLIRGIIQKTIKPTKEMKKFLAELGFASGEAAIQTLGFATFLEKLDEKTRGSSTELGKLFNRVRAITGGLIFAGRGVDEFNKTLAQIDGSGVETLDKASATVLASLGKRFDKVKNQIINFFLIDIGPPVLEVLLSITEKLIKAGSAVKGFAKTLENSRAASVAYNSALATIALVSMPALILGLAALSTAALPAAIVAFISLATAIEAVIVAQAAFLLTPVGAALAALIASGIVLERVISLGADTYNRAAIAAEKFTQSLEDNAKAIQAARKKILGVNINEVKKALDTQIVLLRNSLAVENSEIDKANNVRIESLKKIRKASSKLNAEFVTDTKKRATEARAIYTKMAGQVGKTAEEITKSFLVASKQLFNFDISVAVDRTQLNLIESQLTGLRAQQAASAAAGDKANFDRVSAQIKVLTKQRFDAIKRVGAARLNGDKSVFAARAELIRAQAKGDAKGVQAAKDKLTDAKVAVRDGTRLSKEELDAQQQIAQIKRAISRTSRSGAESKALQLELKAAQETQAFINRQAKEEESQRRKILDVFKEESDLRLKLADDLAKKAKVALKEETARRVLAAELVELEKKRSAFSLKKTLAQSDPAKIKSDADEQIAVLNRFKKLQESTLPNESKRKQIEQEIALIREASQTAAVKATNIEQDTRARLFKDEKDDRLKAIKAAIDAENAADAKRIATITNFLAQEASTLVDGDQVKFSSAGNISNQTRKELAAEKDLLLENARVRQDNFNKIEFFLEREIELQRVANELKSGKDIKQQESSKLIDSFLKEGTGVSEASVKREQRDQSTLPEFARDNPTKVAVDAAKAVRPIKIETAKLAAAAAAKTTAAEEKKLADAKKKAEIESINAKKKLDKQKADQARISLAGKGLTGIAKRIAEADERGKIRGLRSGFQSQKQGAQDRQDQRDRNKAFLSARRDKLFGPEKKATGTSKGSILDPLKGLSTAPFEGLFKTSFEDLARTMLEGGFVPKQVAPGPVASGPQKLDPLSAALLGSAKGLTSLGADGFKLLAASLDRAIEGGFTIPDEVFNRITKIDNTPKKLDPLSTAALEPLLRIASLGDKGFNLLVTALDSFERVNPTLSKEDTNLAAFLKANLRDKDFEDQSSVRFNPLTSQRLPRAVRVPEFTMSNAPINVNVRVQSEFTIDKQQLGKVLAPVISREINRGQNRTKTLR